MHLCLSERCDTYDPTVPDTVETSSNLAIITIGEGKAAIKILARSSSDSMKEYLTTSWSLVSLWQV